MSAEKPSTKKNHHHQTKRIEEEEEEEKSRGKSGGNPNKKKEQTTILQVMGKQQSDILLRNARWKFRGFQPSDANAEEKMKERETEGEQRKKRGMKSTNVKEDTQLFFLRFVPPAERNKLRDVSIFK